MVGRVNVRGGGVDRIKGCRTANETASSYLGLSRLIKNLRNCIIS